jgi:Domain of unknown function (DUF4124)
MRSFLFTLIPIVCSVAIAGTVYKWVDEDGVVHYSDQPHPNAQKLQLKDAQTYRAQPVESTRANAAANAPASLAPTYQGCAIVQPTDSQDFSNVDSLTVVVQTDPKLRPGDQVFVTYDGQPLNGSSATGGTFVISPVDRGTHTLQAVVRSSDGTIMCQSSGITFNVHQPSLLNPVNPIRPH